LTWELKGDELKLVLRNETVGLREGISPKNASAGQLSVFFWGQSVRIVPELRGTYALTNFQ
jgi:hypothetical protein